ncbi:MAG: division/cell wall cluster transcriptional repressor MraZ [Elusimicrobiaceae bacterium]|nr:division/cell wall cluster transcriptional repressor MraZ [Elusimicrobiaceae bacterium]
MPAFYGITQYRLDPKNRLFLPAAFRAALKKEKGGHFMLTTGLNGCLYLFLPSQWEALLANNMQAFRGANPEQERAFKRFFFGNAQEAQVDSAGRILLSAIQRQYAALERETVIVGVGNKAEIWSDKRWHKYNDEAIKPNEARFSKIYDI